MWTRLHKRTSYGEISKFFRKAAGDNLHLCKRALVSKFCSTSYASWTFRATATAASGFALGLAMLGGDGSLIPANCDQAPAPPAKLAASYDFVVVGAGVAGLSALFGILSVRPGSRILVVDSDADALRATLTDPVPELRALQDQHGPVERLPGVQFAPGVAAVRLDPEARALALQGGARVAYAHGCLLATGREVAPPFHLPPSPSAPSPLHYAPVPGHAPTPRFFCVFAVLAASLDDEPSPRPETEQR